MPCPALPWHLGAEMWLCGMQVVATDGDADLVRLVRKNAAHNVPAPLQQLQGEALAWDRAEAEAFRARHGAADLLLLSDVVYGSDPGVWAALLDTLEVLAAPGARVMQVCSGRTT